MIKIKKGDSVLTVTPGAYRNFFKRLGYEPVDAHTGDEISGVGTTHPHGDSQHLEDSAQTESDEYASEEEYSEDEDEADEEPDLSEIPLGEMKLSQLIAYAEQLGLEHDGTPNKKELRKLIRDHLNQQ